MSRRDFVLGSSVVESYLARLDLAPPSSPTPGALAELLRAHVRHVPFENLLIQLGRPAPLHPDATTSRISRGGGGYCLELNGAFGALLTALGYEVREHEGRCWIGGPDPPDAPINHLTLTVRCGDGSWWLAEVGMSDAVCEPLPLRPGEHRQGPFTYRLETITGAAGAGWRFLHDPRGSFGGMDFFLAPARHEVIEGAHRRLSSSPESPFTQLLSVARRDLSGAEILRGRVLTRWNETGTTVRRYDDRDEWLALLTEYFGLPVDELGTSDRTRLWTRVCAAHHAWESASSGVSA